MRQIRGFSLVEVTIVLAVMGVVVGGVFVAYGTVLKAQKIKKANEILQHTVAKMRELYATKPYVDQLSMVVGGDSTGSALLWVQVGVFPAYALQSSATADPNRVYNPWRGTVSVAWASSTGSSSVRDGFSVTFDNLSVDACAPFIQANTGVMRDPQLAGISVEAAGTAVGTNIAALTTYTYPLDATTVNTLCGNAGSAPSPRFYFLLK